MDKPIRVFISSTWEDLQPEREAVEKALHRMQDTAFAGMEYFGSRPETPMEISLAEVDRSGVYIGIFAHRYGSGITEAEYRRARERGLPCLIYLKDDSVPVPPAPMEGEPEKTAKLEALKGELKAHHTLSFFKSPDQLATQVVADLHNLLAAEKTGEPPAEPSSKYQISITDAQGVVIGDGARVVIGGEGDVEAPADSAESLKRQLAEAEANLELIHERKAQYVLEVDVPLQLVKEERRLQARIAELKKKMGAPS